MAIASGMASPMDPFARSKQAAPIAPSNDVAFGSPGAYSAAVNTNANDYDKIMNAYDSLLKSNQQSPAKFTPIAPQLANYSQSGDVTSALGNLSSLSQSGGYSPGDEQNIRARSISPIRSIYSTAQEGLQRQKALQGGYSPNYTAASAKMAREMSEQIGQRVTDVEGQIAQQRAQNKLSIAPSYASAAAQADSARNAIEKSNADTVNQINELNAQLALSTGQMNQSNMFNAVEGMRNLYGTSPALVNTFGNQVSQAGNLANQTQQTNNQTTELGLRKNQNNLGIAGMLMGSGRNGIFG